MTEPLVIKPNLKFVIEWAILEETLTSFGC